jgi:DNA-binding transcriptional LysR family regulator
LVIAIPVDHLAHAPLEQVSQLADENFIMCRRYEDPGYRELVDVICLRAGFTPRVLQAVEHKSTILDLVAEGLGIPFVQRSAAAGRSDIRYLPFPASTPHVDSVIAWRDDANHHSITLFVETAEREATVLPALLPV